MGKFCALRACPNRDLLTSNDKRVKHYSFPSAVTGDRFRRHWVSFVNNCNRSIGAKVCNPVYLCSEHFEEGYILQDGLHYTAVPTKAPMFTAELAYKYGIIPSPSSRLLEAVNNFDITVEELLKLKEDDKFPSASSCEKWDSHGQQFDTDSSPKITDSSEAVLDKKWKVHEHDFDGRPKPFENVCPKVEPYDSIDIHETELMLFDPLADTVSDDVKPASQNTSTFPKEQVTSTSYSRHYSSIFGNGRKFYVGDLVVEDFSTPARAEKSLHIVHSYVRKSRKQIRALQCSLKRAQAKIKELQSEPGGESPQVMSSNVVNVTKKSMLLETCHLCLR